MGDDELTVPDAGDLPLLRLLLQGAGSQTDGEQKTLQPETRAHSLQLHTDRVQCMDILRGELILLYLIRYKCSGFGNQVHRK